jgi:acetyl esterase/lipase
VKKSLSLSCAARRALVAQSSLYLGLSLGALLICLALATCAGGPETNEKHVRPGELATDLRYGSGDQNLYDILLPKGASGPVPLILCVHGGDWSSGDKAEFRDFIPHFVERGYACASVNYRYVDGKAKTYREIMADLGACLADIRRNSSKWGIDPSRILLIGASAGGHLCLLFAHRYDKGETVRGVIALSAASDLTKFATFPAATQALIDRLAPGEDARALASPALSVAKVPTLLFHGTGDEVVPYEQSRIMKRALDAQRVPCSLTLFVGAGHAVFGESAWYFREGMKSMDAFAASCFLN